MQLRSSDERGTGLLRGYGPLAAMVGAFVLMVTLVPSKAGGSGSGGPSAAPNLAQIVAGKPATGEDKIKACAGKKEQVANDPYSPPCFEFSGENGGATAPGVTATEINVGYRKVPLSDLSELINKFAGKPDIPQDKIASTAEALVDYFNKNFQMYGRKLSLKVYDSKTTTALPEFTGEIGQAGADAITAAKDNKVFADISGNTQPFNEALTKQKVIAIGAPYLSDKYFEDRRPYAWSMFPSCSIVSKAASEVTIKMLANKPAQYAGGSLKGKPRKFAILHPDNQEYSTCTAAGIAEVKAAGINADEIKYSLDATKLGTTAVEVATKLKAEGYTNVGCACDPVFPQFMLPVASQNGYFPEWSVMGTALTDTDGAAQVFAEKAPDQWIHAFGATALGAQKKFQDTAAYKAFKTIKPNEEPPTSVVALYNNLYLLSIGVQMAGPQLKPDTFEQGMFAYPEHAGEGGAWKWEAHKYTPQTSADIIWWDADRISDVNGQKGSYRVVPGGPYKLGTLPIGEPEVFKK